MRKIVGILIALMGCSHAYARDGFEKVRCGSDIAKALIGQRGSDEPVMAIEGRHKDLDLKDLGACLRKDQTTSSNSWNVMPSGCAKIIKLILSL
jgi:hypothetical protein